MVNSFPGYLSLKLQAEGLKNQKNHASRVGLGTTGYSKTRVPESEQAPDTNALNAAPG
jgi:hypothetical protein